MIDDKSFLRYSRQLLLNEIGFHGQNLLNSATILLVGLGGLGSPAAFYLAAAGIGKLILADNDKLQLTNLQRQILYNTNEIGKFKADLAKNKLTNLNPENKYISLIKKLDNDNLIKQVKTVDLVLDCSDNMETRHNINYACVYCKKPLITASATGFDGQIITFTPPWENGCYSCLFPNKNNINDINCNSFGILGPIVGIMGTMQALEAIKFLCNIKINFNQGQLWLFNGKSLQWKNLHLTKNTNCSICS
ncbi:molybdopterin-synthase adenylyltransferase MoeB (plasmid) [Candidatus Pantoea edessiphila]|uniref:Molybdopterin-synthase adenylyltransferase MoeB n=1 Tax=Candidatus Pantoea edessiphila TaxID=2044610 RepID=A0A2P5SZ98_9GAMM|nr:HesA/MoeB/ThiF family protein [Candidatus Pantoea edessiphila]PPI87630.1 molybdopterin-synthase adenylyltransferase MoeB [Candidatus Pantoea edessiphila]